MKLLKNKILIAIIVSILTTSVAAFISHLDIGQKWHLNFANSLYTRDEPSEKIVIVALDDKTREIKIPGVSNLSQISRADYAKVIEEIAKGEPKVLAIDFILDKPEKNISGRFLNDAMLNLILAESENEKKDIALDFLEQFSDNQAHPSDRSYLSAINKIKQVVMAATGNIVELKENGAYIYDNDTRKFPLNYFDENEKRAGMVFVNPSIDGLVREIPLVFESNGRDVKIESFAMKTARRFLRPESDIGKLEKNSYKSELGDIPTEDGKMMINYFAEPFGFKMVSFGDVYRSEVDSGIFKDKIVLLGPTATILQDLHPTPIDEEKKMPGVEIQANAIQTILDKKFLSNQGNASRLTTALLMAVVAAAILAYLNIWVGIGLVAVLAAVYTGVAHLMYRQGLVLNMLQPYVTLAITVLAMLIYRYIFELRDKFQLKGVFSHYVSPKVIAEVMQHPEKLQLGGENREITVFFSDIANFTKMSESLTPQCLVSLINEYLDTMTKVILQNKGTLDKFEGDAIMAFFGAPLDDPHHAFNACNAALQCRKTLYLLHKKWEEQAPGDCPKKPPVEFRIGIASGPAIVGNMGSSERFDYTAMGDTVNLGSRLESVNKVYGCRIIISEKVYVQVNEHFDFRELDVIQVKGKKEPVRIYQLMGYKNQLAPSMQKVVHAFHQGLALYRQGQFEQAESWFINALQFIPDDGPSKEFIRRCEILKKNKPQNWNGIFVMQTK